MYCDKVYVHSTATVPGQVSEDETMSEPNSHYFIHTLLPTSSWQLFVKLSAAVN